MKKARKIKSKQKVITYAFIDATNIIYGTARTGWKVDFDKLSKYLRERYGVTKLLYYAGVDTENLKQLKFYEKLQDFGYTLRLVPVKTFKNGKKKADVDSRMTFEIMLLFDKYSEVIVFTGDGDYFWVLEYLVESGKGVKLFGCGNSVARELKQLLKGSVTDINLLRKIISYHKNEADTFKGSASRDYGKRISKKKSSVKKNQLKKSPKNHKTSPKRGSG